MIWPLSVFHLLSDPSPTSHFTLQPEQILAIPQTNHTHSCLWPFAHAFPPPMFPSLFPYSWPSLLDVSFRLVSLGNFPQRHSTTLGNPPVGSPSSMSPLLALEMCLPVFPNELPESKDLILFTSGFPAPTI